MDKITSMIKHLKTQRLEMVELREKQEGKGARLPGGQNDLQSSRKIRIPGGAKLGEGRSQIPYSHSRQQILCCDFTFL